MAQIYKNQLMWKSEGQKKFKGDPIKDYIGDGLRNVASAAQQATDMINRIKDEEAAGKMEVAAKAAQDYLTNFQDFSGDNYLEVMETESMKIWDDAFSTLDSATQTRFLFNNPEARDIFALKVAEAATERTYDHVRVTKMNEIPLDASGIVNLVDPNKMQAALENQIARIESMNMRPEDVLEYASKLRYEVATGAIYSAIGRNDFEMANGMVHNPYFVAALSPREQEQIKSTIRNAYANSFESQKEGMSSAAKKRLSQNVNLGTGIVDMIMRDASLGSRDERFKFASAFLTSMLAGEAADLDSFAWANKRQMYGFLDALTEVPDSERQLLVKEIAAAAFPNSRELDRAIGKAQAHVSMLIKKNEDKDFSKWTSDDVALAYELVSTYRDIMSFSPELRKAFAPLEEVVGIQSLADQLEIGGFGPAEVEFSRTGFVDSFKDMNPAAQITAALQRGASNDVVYSKKINQMFADATYKLAARLNDGSEPANGTYVEAIARTAVLLGNAPVEMKRELGIEHVTTDELSMMLWRKRYDLATTGKLNEYMPGGSVSGDMLPEAQQDEIVKSVNSLFYGSAPDKKNILQMDQAKKKARDAMDSGPIEQSEDYKLLSEMIAMVAPDAAPNANAMKTAATMLKRGRHQYTGWIADVIHDVDSYLRSSDDYVKTKYEQVTSAPIE